ncbi:NAD-binding protein [Candidatus Saccharibacteria bacterium]|nr:NAD-binding protein [Candidatus Saccharibacteria bacterium]
MVDAKLIRKLIFFSVLIIATGATVLSLTEQISFVEGLYRSVYLVLAHHDNFYTKGLIPRLTVVGLIVSSLVIIGYLIKILADYMINLGDGLKRNKVKAQLLHTKEHFIICGLGRVGSQVARELADEHLPFVAIDRDEDKVKEAIKCGYTAFVGDSTKEEVLAKAKIDKAKGLVAALGEDYHNLFVTLAARQINPGLFIVARVNNEANKERMLQAGADKVAQPSQIGGFHMAAMVLRPNVVDFLEVLSTNKNSELQVEELVVPRHSKVIGDRLSTLANHNTGATVLAINNADGGSRVNPSGKEMIYAGDKLIVMGTRTQLDALSTHV